MGLSLSLAGSKVDRSAEEHYDVGSQRRTRRNDMKTKHKSGFSLIEIMVAVILLVVLALGGAAVMYQTGGGVQRQQNKREAIVAANQLLEALWSTTYTSLGSNPSTSTSATSVNGNSMPVTVTISSEQTNADGDNYYDIQISISYMTGDTVEINSRRYEKGLSKAMVN